MSGVDRESIAASLTRLAEIAESLEDGASAREAMDTLERVGDARFYVACVGQFKRGKSTLLDALLGDLVLPIGITPVTAVPTVVRFGGERMARVRDDEGVWRTIPVESLGAYVSEDLNPCNEKGVTAAEVLEPSPLLSHGLCLVDTPGLGSVFEANAQATLAFVPHIDVALVVIGTDPPLSGDELRLIESIAAHVDHLLVVLNKADRAAPPEREEACVFAKKAIEQRLGRSIGRIFEVSAKDVMTGDRVWPDWARLTEELDRLAAESGRSLAVTAGTRALWRLCARLASDVARAEQLLKAPMQVIDARVMRLAALTADVDRKIQDLSPVLAAQERRLAEQFNDTAREFARHIAATAHDRLRQRLKAKGAVFGPRFRRKAMVEAQAIARQAILEWRPHVERQADAIVRESMRRFAESAVATWTAARDAGGDELDELPDVDEMIAPLERESRFQFNEQITLAQPASPLRFVADVVFVVVGLRSAILRDANRFLDWLLELNSTRVQSDLVERLGDGRAALERMLRSTLASTRERAQTALTQARATRVSGQAAVERELARLGSLKAQLDTVSDACNPHGLSGPDS